MKTERRWASSVVLAEPRWKQYESNMTAWPGFARMRISSGNVGGGSSGCAGAGGRKGERCEPGTTIVGCRQERQAGTAGRQARQADTVGS
jgi:hypothetical protein